MTRLRSLTLAVLASAFAAGCASAPRPDAQIVRSEGAIRGATEAGAADVPAATLHVRLAREQRQAALAMIANGENERARFVLARSEADAELAIALAREAAAEAEADRANARIQDLNRQVIP